MSGKLILNRDFTRRHVRKYSFLVILHKDIWPFHKFEIKLKKQVSSSLTPRPEYNEFVVLRLGCNEEQKIFSKKLFLRLD